MADMPMAKIPMANMPMADVPLKTTEYMGNKCRKFLSRAVASRAFLLLAVFPTPCGMKIYRDMEGVEAYE